MEAALDNLNLAYLQARLNILDFRLRRAVRAWQAAGQDPGDEFRGLYISDQEASTLASRRAFDSPVTGINLADDEELAYQKGIEAATAVSRQLSEQAQAAGKALRLESLKSIFGLSLFEEDTLLLCLAPDLDVRYERLYGYLQDDVTHRRPSVNLALELLCGAGVERLQQLGSFNLDRPLLGQELLEKLPVGAGSKTGILGQSFRIDESIFHWLIDVYQPASEWRDFITLETAAASQTDRLLAGERLANLGYSAILSKDFSVSNAAWDTEQSYASGSLDTEQSLLALYGPDEITQRAAARLLANESGRPLMIIDLAGALKAGLNPGRLLKTALRDCRLNAAIPFVPGWEALLEYEASHVDPAYLLKQLAAYPGPALLSSARDWPRTELDQPRRILAMYFPLPDFEQRVRLWEHFLGYRATLNNQKGLLCIQGAGLAKPEIQALAGQFTLSSAQVRDAAALAQDLAAASNRAVEAADGFAAARQQSSSKLASLARKIVPRFGWDDIILPPDPLAQLREIIQTARARPVVLESWGVGLKLASSRGITILFAGPPGTGKTMAAEIIAGELGLDLYKIELSGIISKYIGETEKNLERIFNEADSSNAILFFDEADAVFGKRSEVRDAHDRYANIEISYLLQRMEAYNGITILATNLRANLDEAFTRRLQFAIDFPFPDDAHRLQIWQTLFPPNVPRADALDFAGLAGKFKLAGGSIRNVLVSAAYLAAADGGVVTMDHLLHGIRRELQKMGRLVQEGDF